jgi:DNA polymerase/3'-5' exonuclease PolX
MLLSEALPIAQRLQSILHPYCTRIEIAGSIRRKKPEVKDIEIVCIPQQVPSDMFGNTTIAHPEFCRLVNSFVKIKGEPTGRYTQRLLPEGIKADIFICTPENWGLIFAIRTGSADFSAKVLGPAWGRQGYRSEDGYLTRNGERVAVYEEEELFRLLHLPFITPEERSYTPSFQGQSGRIVSIDETSYM